MSLDVYLRTPGVNASGTGIFIREDGANREITRAEWDERFPAREPVMVERENGNEVVYRANITHNLCNMASEAGLYEALWRPDEHGIVYAHQLIDILRPGLERLRNNPEHYKTFNPENGWGNYDGLIAFIENYLKACETYPHAKIEARR